jgi:SAM-dependent methyltransferase
MGYKGAMIPLSGCLTNGSAEEDLKRLSNPKLDLEKDRDEINRLVIGFLVRYLAAYLDIPESKNIQSWMSEIRMVVEFTVLSALSDFQETGDVDPHEPGGDNYALRCLADLRQTAAIFKEILFNDRFQKGRAFFGLDLGSGTGILSIAMALAAKRKGIGNIHVVGIERSSLAVDRAQKAIRTLGLEKEIEFVCNDLIAPSLFQDLGMAPKIRNSPSSPKGRYFEIRNLSYWVSETISIAVPKFDPFEPGFDLHLKSPRGRKSELRSDPFVEILKKTVDTVPDFLENVKSGKTAMFPDLANGLYAPDGNQSKMKLRTGLEKTLPLERLGQEFEAYGDLGLKFRRWGKEEDYR